MCVEEFRMVFKTSLCWYVVEEDVDDGDNDPDFLTTVGTRWTKTSGIQNIHHYSLNQTHSQLVFLLSMLILFQVFCKKNILIKF